MNKAHTISTNINYHKSDKLERFIKQAKRYGYLQQIKQITKTSPNDANQYDIQYRKKAKSYYGKKIAKPFKLMEQPEYLRELRFNSDLRAYQRSIPEFQAIREQPFFTMPSQIVQREKNNEKLVFDPCKNCDVSPDNIKKRMIEAIGVQGNTQDLYELNRNIFPTKINLSNTHQIRPQYRIGNQSRIQIILNSGARSLSQVSPPKTSLQKKNQIYKQLNKSTLTNKLKSNRTIKHTWKKTGISSSQISNINLPYINQTTALDNLNKLIGSDQKLKSFRVSKQKLHEVVVKKFGHDIITNFFSLQNLQNFQGIINFTTEILSIDDRVAQLLTFLTFDQSQDGVITEDELIQINNQVDFDSPIREDINKIVNYAKQNPQLKCQADIPPSFLKYPTYKEYIRMMENVKEEPIQKIRGIYRLFSLKMEKQDEKNDYSRPFPVKQQEVLKKKNIRINFEHFQKIFQGTGQPKFIQQFVGLLIGKNHKKPDQLSNSPKDNIRVSMNYSNGKKLPISKRSIGISESKSFASNDFQYSHLTKAQLLLKQLHRDQQNLATVQFT